MCKHSGEDNNHLFLHCVVARLALLCDAFFGDGVVVLVIWWGEAEGRYSRLFLYAFYGVFGENVTLTALRVNGRREERGERGGGGDLNLDVNI